MKRKFLFLEGKNTGKLIKDVGLMELYDKVRLSKARSFLYLEEDVMVRLVEFEIGFEALTFFRAAIEDNNQYMIEIVGD